MDLIDEEAQELAKETDPARLPVSEDWERMWRQAVHCKHGKKTKNCPACRPLASKPYGELY